DHHGRRGHLLRPGSYGHRLDVRRRNVGGDPARLRRAYRQSRHRAHRKPEGRSMKRFCECRQAMVYILGACIGCEDRPEPPPFMDTPGDITCPPDVPPEVWDIALRAAVEAVAITKPIADIVAQAIIDDRK